MVKFIFENCGRCKKVYDGVNHAAKLFPNAWVILFITGLVKGILQVSFNRVRFFNCHFCFLGNGGGFIKIMERLVRGVWTPTAFEFLQPSLYV